MTMVERIKKISKERGWNLKQTATKAGIGVNSIYRWKDQSPTAESLEKVADVLDVSVDYLLGKTDTEQNSNEPSGPVDLDKALSEEGMAMFDGKPLSEEYKKALLAMLRANKNSGE